MSAFALAGSFNVTGSLIQSGTPPDSAVSDTVQIGGNGFPAINPQIAQGTGAGQCQWQYHGQRTVAATTFDTLNLYLASGGLVDQLGNPITATGLKLFLLEIVNADGIMSLRVGPQGVTNAAQLWFGGVAASNYETITDGVLRRRLLDSTGWPIAATTACLLPIYNPGANPVTYQIWLLGI